MHARTSASWLLALGLTLPAPATVAAVAVSGMYQVPADGAAATERADFPVSEIALTGSVGERRLHFELPEDLTGGKVVAVDMKELVGSKGVFVTFKGDSADEGASCDVLATAVVCIVHYRPDIAAKATLEAFLSKKYKAPAKLGRMLATALRYQNEPAGVLTFSLAGK